MTQSESGDKQSALSTADVLRQRRIHYHKMAAFILTALLFVIAPVWIYLRLMLCWGSFNDFLCSHSYLIPLILILLAGVANVLTMWVLMKHGAELEMTGKISASSRRGLYRGIGHMRSAYRDLDSGHRADVRQTVFVFFVTWGALFAFLVWFFFMIPAGVGLLLGILFVLLGPVINWLLSRSHNH